MGDDCDWSETELMTHFNRSMPQTHMSKVTQPYCKVKTCRSVFSVLVSKLGSSQGKQHVFQFKSIQYGKEIIQLRIASQTQTFSKALDG